MHKLNLEDTEIGYKLQDHSYCLNAVADTMEIFKYCIENDIFISSRVELYNFAKIITDYVMQMQKDFLEIKKELNIA